MITLCTAVLTSIPGYFVNTINFTGAQAEYDPEAEFRLAKLGRSIVEAKLVTLNASVSLKTAYAASLRNRESQHSHFVQTLAHSTEANVAWANVANDFRDTRQWLDGKLRADYSQAFVDAATDRDLHPNLVGQHVSRDYMAFAFEAVRAICEDNLAPAQVILACFDRLEKLARECAERVNQFTLYIEELQREDDFSLYGYIFDCLAVRGEKPRLYELDEAYFTVHSEFEITYEAVEQIARHAHTLVPGTHGQEPRFFDLNFTE